MLYQKQEKSGNNKESANIDTGNRYVDTKRSCFIKSRKNRENNEQSANIDTGDVFYDALCDLVKGQEIKNNSSNNSAGIDYNWYRYDNKKMILLVLIWQQQPQKP
jgi:hypothetical protein